VARPVRVPFRSLSELGPAMVNRPGPRITAVFFDVGETIVDETREYGTGADWLDVPRHTFSAVFGAVTARGGIIGTHSSTSEQALIWRPSGSAGRRLADPRPSPTRTSTPTRARTWASYSRGGCGLA
jgi:hypothetical protein